MNSTPFRLLCLAVLVALCPFPATASISLSEGPWQRWKSPQPSTPPPGALYRLLPVPPLAGASYRSEQGLSSWIIPSSPETAPAHEGPGLISQDFELLALYEETELYARIIQRQHLDPWLLNELLSALIKFGGRFITANFSCP